MGLDTNDPIIRWEKQEKEGCGDWCEKKRGQAGMVTGHGVHGDPLVPMGTRQTEVPPCTSGG